MSTRLKDASTPSIVPRLIVNRLKDASTPSIVPRLMCRPHISHNTNMPSPVQHTENAEKIRNLASKSCGSYGATDDEQNLDVSLDDSFENDSTASISEDCDTTSNNEAVEFQTTLQSNTGMKEENSEECLQNQRVNKNRSINENIFNIQHVLCAIIFIIACAAIAYMPNNDMPVITINTLKKSFPQQDETFWVFIKSGVLEIKNFEKPSVIILMYRDGMSSVTDEILSSVTKYASCILNENCSVEPIVLTGKDLNTKEIIKDYGILIDKYRLLLEKRHIMIVKNMEEISGVVAQAFHYFCDEFTPLVKKSFIIFTIKVNEYEGKEIQQVVDILEEKWSAVDHDKLQALITRVSSIVLRIK